MSPDGQDIGSRVTADGPPSTARGRREVLIAGHRAPASPTANRGRHLKKLAGARKYVWSLALIGGGVFLIGASTGRVIWAVIPPLIVLAVVIAMVWKDATRLALRDYFAGYALNHHFNFSERLTLPEKTPLLAAGDRRRCENYMEGPLEGSGDLSVGLSHFVYETLDERADRRNRPITVFTPHNLTIAAVEIPRAASVFKGVFLSRRGGVFGRDGWLDRKALGSMELSNSELANRYEVLAAREVDRKRLLDLFSPAFQVWLAELPFQLYFEYHGGMLVTYVPKRLKEGRELDVMLSSASWIAGQILREGEPLQAVGESQGPPTGVAAFPPPPPATKPAVEEKSEVKLRAAPDPVEAPTYTRASVPPPSAH